MHRPKFAVGLVAALAFTASAATMSTPSSAAVTGAVASHKDPNTGCIDQALASAPDSWTCFGDVLTTARRDSSGDMVVTSSLVEVPTVPAYAEDASSASSAMTGKQSNAEELAVVASDDYDTWCESGTICGRKVTDYIAEVKGNGAYGDRNGVIGRVDVILRQAFDGPWPRWRGTLIWDSGPAITTTKYRVSCRINVTGPDGFCGGTDFYYGTISSGNWRTWYPSSTGYTYNSQRLVGSTYYHEDASGSFTAAGRSLVFHYGPLHTGRWRYCSSNCKYYQVPWVA